MPVSNALAYYAEAKKFILQSVEQGKPFLAMT
jgi:hypothetical protein